MTFYTFPEVSFQEFDEDFDFRTSSNIMGNLIRFCGFRSLHQESFLYQWLQRQIKYFKFSGELEFRQWCTFPAACEWHEKMPTHRMTLTLEQMTKWIEYLLENEDHLRQHCVGPAWSKYYKSNNH